MSSIDPELSPKAHRELIAIADELCKELLALHESENKLRDYGLGGGMTRIGPFERLIESFGDAKTFTERIERITESILIRVRQDRYSSVGYIESISEKTDGLNVSIFCEHETRIAYSFHFRLKKKRPNAFVIGNPDTKRSSSFFFTHEP